MTNMTGVGEMGVAACAIGKLLGEYLALWFAWACGVVAGWVVGRALKAKYHERSGHG